jgi:hypothetical protein
VAAVYLIRETENVGQIAVWGETLQADNIPRGCGNDRLLAMLAMFAMMPVACCLLLHPARPSLLCAEHGLRRPLSRCDDGDDDGRAVGRMMQMRMRSCFWVLLTAGTSLASTGGRGMSSYRILPSGSEAEKARHGNMTR